MRGEERFSLLRRVSERKNPSFREVTPILVLYIIQKQRPVHPHHRMLLFHSRKSDILDKNVVRSKLVKGQ